MHDFCRVTQGVASLIQYVQRPPQNQAQNEPQISLLVATCRHKIRALKIDNLFSKKVCLILRRQGLQIEPSKGMLAVQT
jgi:hypothetical protein